MALLKLILAHLLGDFLFQTKQVIILKNSVRFGAWAHHLIVFACNCLLFFNRLNEPYIWLGIGLISVLHVMIDELKLRIIRQNPQRDTLGLFLLDQLTHLVIILAVAWWWKQSGLLIPSNPEVINIGAWIILGILNTYFLSLLLYYIEKAKHPRIYQREYRKMLARLLIGVSVFMGLLPLTLMVLVVYFLWLYRIKVRRNILVQSLAGNLLSLFLSWGVLQIVTIIK